MGSTSSPTPANTPAKSTWADIVVDSGKVTLSFHPPEFRNGRLVVPDDVLAVGLKSWNNCLVGNNTLLFQIPDPASREWVLHSKIPWHASQRTLYLQPWKPDLELSKIKPSEMQLCVKIWGVPITLYTPQGLGHVASAIGAPVCLDNATEERVHINYAQCSHRKSLVSPSIRPAATSGSSASNISGSSSPQSVAILSRKLHVEVKMITGASPVQIADPSPPTSPVTFLQAPPALPVMGSTSSPTPANTPAKSTWADVVVDSGKVTLSFHPPEFRNGRLVVPDDVLAVGLKSWNNCLVVESWVLHSKIPWHPSQRTLYLQPWKPDLELSKIKPSEMQLCVKIWGVPITLYTPQGLGHVASAIGAPVCLDNATEERVHINYAQVCVEVDADKVADLPSLIPIDGVNQQPIELLFECPWLPVHCGNCKKEGHLKRDCTKKLQRGPTKKQEWKVISRNKTDEELEKVATVASTSHSSFARSKRCEL
ncbi:hypothetical protein SLEP1_g37968 [Rubroshorea leprosula]|uniref:CCHC-type domain-containing protein n=1 Tax=Rubroshorea leprosula TaxID=152421 RepID=A0AAV5KWX7_9ROSI|nr:hypothetical protein SLEP1_g37968 [Rubroshorea leprosula]